MLTNKEFRMVQALLKTAIDSQRQELENFENDNHRDAAEKKLISLVSAKNKLRHIADKNIKKRSELGMPKLLLVDDAPSMLGVASKLFSEVGFEKIKTVENADKALKLLLADAASGVPYDIVITDWEMEGKTGLDLLKIIRTSEALLDTHVFILTSHSEQQNIVSAIEAGVTGYLLKPINFKMLEKKFKEYLPEIETNSN